MANMIPIGEHMWLHTGDTVFSLGEHHLIISSHGAAVGDRFTVPEWADVNFYGRHGSALSIAGLGEVMEGRVQVVERVGGGETCQNYGLTKYQGRHGAPSETYDSIRTAIQINNAFLESVHATMASGSATQIATVTRRMKTYQNYAFKFHVLTMRNVGLSRVGLHSVLLSTALAELGARGYLYDQIHCSFCRYIRGGATVEAPDWGTQSA